MVECAVNIAGYSIEISTFSFSSCHMCRQYIAQEKVDFSVTINHKDISIERQKTMKEAAIEGLPPREYSDEELEITAVLRKVTEALFDYDTLLFHGSTISVDNEAYLFTAKSGTGKSTHTRLWREMLGDKAIMVNDDKPFLKIGEDGVLACGSPWNGKHRLGNNIQVPLKAICILERGVENHIKEIPPKEALTMLIQQSARPADPKKMAKYMELIDRLTQKVKFYRMQCTMDPAAAQMAYEEMSK